MKMRHSQQSEPDVISVFVGTWNMGKRLEPTSRGANAISFYSSFVPPIGLCRGLTSSTGTADLDDVLWFGTHS